MPELLAIDALDAGYNGTPVVRDLTLNVAAGEVVALLGPNGAGKSTTLNTIAELLLPVLRRIAEELGAGVLFVEQHVALALEVADRAYVLSHGRLVLEGKAADLRGRRDLLQSSYLGEAAVPATA